MTIIYIRLHQEIKKKMCTRFVKQQLKDVRENEGNVKVKNTPTGNTHEHQIGTRHLIDFYDHNLSLKHVCSLGVRDWMHDNTVNV